MIRTRPQLQFSTKEQAIYAHLREAIVSGELKPGERLILRQIAETVGVSEIPVREAMKRLEAEGLVQLRPHAGAIVTRLERSDLVEIFACRLVNEALAARLAAEHATPEDFATLRGLVDEMAECVERKDASRYGVLNRQFNTVISEACANRYLIDTIRRLQALTDRARALFVWEPGRLARSNQEHAKIVDLLERRDAAGVEALVHSHRKGGYDAFMAALDRVTSDERAVSLAAS